MKHTPVILLLVALLAAAIPTAHASPNIPPANQITSNVTTGGGQTVAVYQVTSGGSPAISHVVIPGCPLPAPTITGCPGAVSYANPDPTTGVTGWKCDAGGSYTSTFTWPGELTTVTANAAIKAGAGFDLVPVEAVTCQSLGIIIGEFTVIANGLDAILTWDVMSEWDNLGWLVFRGPTDNFVDAVLIAEVPSPAPGGAIGAWTYTYTDASLAPGTYYYWLRDIPIAYPPETVGPENVVIEPPTAVSLAAFTAVPSPAPGCYMRRGVCVCAGPLGRLYRAPKMACSIWR